MEPIKVSSKTRTSKTTTHFGRLVEKAREARGVTQATVASMSGVAASTYANIVLGVYPPSTDAFMRLCVTLQIDLTWAIHALAKDMGYQDLLVKPDVARIAAPDRRYLTSRELEEQADTLFRGTKT